MEPLLLVSEYEQSPGPVSVYSMCSVSSFCLPFHTPTWYQN